MCAIYEEVIRRFHSITLTGRLCYIFMCMERYLTGMYPGRDWTPVAERMWPWTEQGSWDGCMQRYYTIVPDLVDFIIDLHDPTLHLSRYRRSTEPGREDYEEMTAMFRGDPDDAADRAFCDLLLKDTDFCRIMLMPVWFNDAVEGICVSGAELTVAHRINELEEILRKHQIAQVSRQTCCQGGSNRRSTSCRCFLQRLRKYNGLLYPLL